MNKLHVIGGFLALCAAVACHPVGPPNGNRSMHQPRPGVPQTVPSTANPADLGANPSQSDSSAALNPSAQPSSTPATSSRPSQASKPAAPADPYITAEKAPGKPGYVRSPHTGKLVLVDGIPSGVVVPDQTCPPGEKKFFRVP